MPTKQKYELDRDFLNIQAKEKVEIDHLKQRIKDLIRK
jgi:hypothetical protein